MATIPQALARIKANLHDFVPSTLLTDLCHQLGYTWRDRLLDPPTTTYLFLQQILHGNTAIGHLRHLSGLDFSEAAYCKARQRLPLPFFRRLQHAVCQAAQQAAPDARSLWRGLRVHLLDGSSFSMPDTPDLQEAFGQPSGQALGCGFPVAHVLLQVCASTGYLLKAIPAPYATHDMAQAVWTHAGLGRGDVLVGDRAFCSYAHLALCQQRQLHGLFRAHQRQIIDFTPGRPHVTGKDPEQAGLPRSRWLKRLGKDDQLVAYVKPTKRPDWMSAQAYAALPERLVVRELRFRVRLPGRRSQVITVVTTLTNARKYSKRALAKLYGLRWQVEVDLRHLKSSMHLDVLRCTTFVGVLKELCVYVVVYNLVRRVMLQAARQQQVPVARISFVDAWRWLQTSRAGEAVPRLKMYRLRPKRVEPRAVKRRPKKYKLLNRPRAVLREALLTQKVAA